MISRSPPGRARDTTEHAGLRGDHAWLANMLAPALILLTSFVGFLRFHDYGLWRPESLIAMALLAGSGLLIAGLIALRPEVLRPAMIALLLILFLDLQFTLQEKEQSAAWLSGLLNMLTGSSRPTAIAAPVLVAGTFLAAGLVTWVLQRHLGNIVTTVFGVILLSTLALPVETIRFGQGARNPGAQPNPALPPVVHLVLDEQIAIEGLPEEVPGAAELRRDLAELYQRHGFAVFGRAFSHYYNSNVSIANLMNGTAKPRLYTYLTQSKNTFGLTKSLWFQDLSERGYRIRVYQSSYLDFCSVAGANIDDCTVYPADSIRSLLETDLGLPQRVRLMLVGNFDRAMIFRYVRAGYHVFLTPFLARLGLRLPADLLVKPTLSALPSLPLIDRISADIAATPGGVAIFAHLLIPHHAYLFDADCRLRPEIASWGLRLDPAAARNADPPSAPRAQAYRHYFEQVRCTHGRVAALLRRMDDAGLLDQATVIIHGDHGSRISPVRAFDKNAERLSDLDLVDNYATFLAIRKPGLGASYNREIRSIQDIFADIVLDRPLAEAHRNVFIFSAEGRTGRLLGSRPMPDFGD